MGGDKKKLAVRNIGMILSGRIEQPVLDGDCVVAVGGRIEAFGFEKDLDIDNSDVIIDANRVTLAPGLIDSHVHPVVGDYTPRQQQLHWIDSTLNGGVTTLISAGEVHMPGRPKDIVGLKAMAIAAQRWYSNFKPSGVKVLAGAPVVEHGMEEKDFKDLADAGVTLLGEVGLGVGQGWTDCQENGRLGAQVRNSEHDSHRRPFNSRLGPYRQGCRSGSGHRRHRTRERRAFGPSRRSDHLPLRTVQQKLGNRAQRKRASRAVDGQYRPRAQAA